MAAKNHVVIEHGTIERIPRPESLLEEREAKSLSRPAPKPERLIHLVQVRSKPKRR